MKIHCRLIQCVAGVVALTGLTAPVHAAVTLPISAAFDTNSVSNPGFVVRTAQASNDVVIANTFLRAMRQVNGILTDANGVPVSNIAIAGPEAGGNYFTDLVSYERDGNFVEPKGLDGLPVGATFGTILFPGIPGDEGLLNNFADESVALVTLEAGVYTLAISANNERTDINDDDGCSVFVGANPRDYFATKIADFARTTGTAGFQNDQRIENLIEVVVPVRGAYPFRVLHWQQGAGSSLQFYVVDTNTQARFLINDTSATLSDRPMPLAFRSTTAAAYNSPYVVDLAPSPGSAGNSSSAQLTVILSDGGTTVNTNTIQLSVNSTIVLPQIITRSGSKTTIKYTPNGNWTTADNAVRLVYADSGAVQYTNIWSFTVNLAGGSSTQVAGQWDFDFGNLAATVGNSLQYLDPAFDGPAGTNANKTQFGTTTSFGIPDINGQVANVMEVPGDLNRSIGYVMNHGIAPNGGGTKVNQYTLIMDVFVDTTGAGAASLWNVGASLNNTDDGDLFWQGSNFGQGTGGYNGYGTFTAGAWHRVVAAYDLAANPPVVTKYVDGIKQADWIYTTGTNLAHSLDAPRRAMQPTAIVFGDGDQDERRKMWVNSIQIRSGKLSDAEMVVLGGPEACGIPATIPQSTATGQWEFDGGDLRAAIGSPLQYLDPAFDNGGALPTPGTNANQTTFGTCSSLGVALINGVDANIMEVPGDLNRSIGYVMDHRIAPNGGGTKVNQYTLIMDVFVDVTGPGAASLWNVGASLNNTDDGDLFWQGSNFGQGTGGYAGYGTFTAGAWHRVVAAYDLAANPPVVTKYIDGIKQDDWIYTTGTNLAHSLDAPRRAMQPTAIVFGDGDQDERRKMWVNSIQIRSGKLSDAECVLLGSPSGNGIPVALPTSTVRGQWEFDGGDLRASIGKPLTYLDPAFDGPTGTNANLTTFGDTTTLGQPQIDGQDVNIMQVPGDLNRSVGYVVNHGIAPNGGGTKVNQYTLIMDVLVDATGPGAASLWNVGASLDNTDDGDLFWQGSNIGQGTGGYVGTGQFTAGAWHRMAVAYDLAATPPVVTKYVDGIFQHDWIYTTGTNLAHSLDAPRRAMQPTAILFGDGDQDERRTMWASSVQIREGALSKAELAALGAPSTNGIPVYIPVEQPPELCFGKIGNQMTLIWPLSATGYTLKSASTVEGPYSTVVPGVVNNSVVVTVGAGNQFFRLEK